MRLTHEQARLVQEHIINNALSIVEAKRHDYSGPDDPFANFRMSEFAGVDAWRGCMVRLMDKLSRIKQFMEQEGELRVKDESILDTLSDAVNYVCILGGLCAEEIGGFGLDESN